MPEATACLPGSDLRRVATNFASLSLLQGANYLLPLVTLPYLVRVLGVEKIGLLAFAQALAACCSMVTDYGFSLTAVRDVAVHRNDPKKVSEIFSTVMLIKLALAALALAALSLAVAAVPALRREWPLYLCSFSLVAAEVLYPVWFFQGMERMKLVTALGVFSKTLFTVSIFLLVSSPADYLYVPLLNAAGTLAAAAVALSIVFGGCGVSPAAPSRTLIRSSLSSGRHIFQSRVFVTLYSYGNIVILGGMGSAAQVGFYSVAEKIGSAVTALAGPFNQSIFPFLAGTRAGDEERFSGASRRLLRLLAAAMSAAAAALFVFAPAIVSLVSGEEYPQSVLILRILAPTVVLSPIGAYLTQLVIIRNSAPILSRVVAVAAAVNMALVVPLVLLYGAAGAAAAVLAVQLLVNLLLLRALSGPEGGCRVPAA